MKPKFGITIFYYILKFLHQIPFSLNLNNLDTKPSKKSIFWTIIFSILYMFHEIFIGNFAYKLRKNINGDLEFYYEYTITNGFLPAMTMLLICIIWNFFKNKSSFKLIVRSKLIFQQISGFDLPWNHQHKINKLLFKYFLTIIINLSVDSIYYILFSNESLWLIIIYSPLTGLKTLIASAILIKYDLLLILIKSSFSQLNKILNEKLVESQNPQLIEELIQIYCNLCKLYEMIMDLITIPLILIVGFNFFVAETAILLLYGSLKHYRTRAFRTVINFLWVFFKVRDVYVVFKDGTGVLKKVSKKDSFESSRFCMNSYRLEEVEVES